MTGNIIVLEVLCGLIDPASWIFPSNLGNSNLICLGNEPIPPLAIVDSSLILLSVGLVGRTDLISLTATDYWVSCYVMISIAL